MDYQIIHSTPGRFRFLIPRLATDPDYVQKLQGSVESIKFVTEVRINPWAKSLVVSYKTRIISSEVVQKHLIGAIEQADSPAPPLSKESPTPTSLPKKNPTPTSPPSVSAPAISQEKSNEASKALIEEKYLISLPQQFTPEEDPWDSDSKSDIIAPPATESGDGEMVPLKPEAMAIETSLDKESKPKDKEEKETVSSLSTAALAKRLQVASQTLTRYRSKPNFLSGRKLKIQKEFLGVTILNLRPFIGLFLLPIVLRQPKKLRPTWTFSNFLATIVESR